VLNTLLKTRPPDRIKFHSKLSDCTIKFGLELTF